MKQIFFLIALSIIALQVCSADKVVDNEDRVVYRHVVNPSKSRQRKLQDDAQDNYLEKILQQQKELDALKEAVIEEEETGPSIMISIVVLQVPLGWVIYGWYYIFVGKKKIAARQLHEAKEKKLRAEQKLKVVHMCKELREKSRASELLMKVQGLEDDCQDAHKQSVGGKDIVYSTSALRSIYYGQADSCSHDVPIRSYKKTCFELGEEIDLKRLGTLAGQKKAEEVEQMESLAKEAAQMNTIKEELQDDSLATDEEEKSDKKAAPTASFLTNQSGRRRLGGKNFLFNNMLKGD